MNHHLVPVMAGKLNGQTTQLCNARELHAFLQVGRDFSTWIKGRIDDYGFVAGEDYVWVENLSPPPPDLGSSKSRAQLMFDYHLTLDMAKELAMLENNEVGRKVRRYFIKVEKQARAMLEEQAKRILPMPGVTQSTRDRLKFKDAFTLQ